MQLRGTTVTARGPRTGEALRAIVPGRLRQRTSEAKEVSKATRSGVGNGKPSSGGDCGPRASDGPGGSSDEPPGPQFQAPVRPLPLRAGALP